MLTAIKASWPYIVGGLIAALLLGLIPMRSYGSVIAGPSDQELLTRWDRADEHCRGDQDYDSPKHRLWCSTRDLTEKTLELRGWHYYVGAYGGWVSRQQANALGQIARNLDETAARRNASQLADMVPTAQRLIEASVGRDAAIALWAQHSGGYMEWYPNAWPVMSEAMRKMGAPQ